MEQVNNEVTELSTNQVNTELQNNQELNANTESKEITLTQSELDKIIGEKVFKAISKKEKELQKEHWKEQGQWKEAFEQTQKELDDLKNEKSKAEFSAKVISYAASEGLSEYADIFKALPDMESVKKISANIKDKLAKSLEEKVAQKLQTYSPVSINSNPLSNLSEANSLEEYARMRKSKLTH